MLRAHQGDLTLLVAAEEEGTAFALWLPLEASAPDAPQPFPAPSERRLARSHA
jgi:hypothetical protein